jgi:hypothetical protein
MINLAPLYLFQRFFYRIGQFFWHWYGKSLKIYSHFVINLFEELDQFFAWRITLKYLTQPLFKDYSIIGRILGPLFRMNRLILGGLIYLSILIIALALYLLWLLFPFYAFYRFFGGWV